MDPRGVLEVVTDKLFPFRDMNFDRRAQNRSHYGVKLRMKNGVTFKNRT